MRPLFVPLKTEYFNAFKTGTKTEELRPYGQRWNESTCQIGREVILSKGYGKHERMRGIITAFKRQHASVFGSGYRRAILACYGTLEMDMACIGITDLTPITAQNG